MKEFFRSSNEAEDAKIQQDSYALEIQNRQHRTHAFTIYLVGKSARIFRWDRAGCIVSKPIDLVKQPEHILNFIYRLSCGGRTMQGIDPTATLASRDEITRLQEYNPDDRRLRQYRDYMIHPESLIDYPIHKVGVQLVSFSCLAKEYSCRSYAKCFPGLTLRRKTLGLAPLRRKDFGLILSAARSPILVPLLGAVQKVSSHSI